MLTAIVAAVLFRYMYRDVIMFILLIVVILLILMVFFFALTMSVSILSHGSRMYPYVITIHIK